ncbi:LytTR family DNA-binding domain-containing protein [uncultured Bacteroides sp.]|uniref:LytR/AlgR family response regulator transcription factor n=1 Tax=uncultured Bacteroides sp. TaxID=162156 RepID=UPI002631BF80|nr:LytTR family DNA-binding domain-containing protein [uncultured Bacteroides sp.]
MRTLIIEDEKAALRNLKAAMQEVDTDFDIVGETDSVADTLEWFASHSMPELVFMDIHLADGSAFGIFEQVDITCPIIFTTAYDEYALQAFRVNSIAYLLKPISSADLQMAIDKLKILGGSNREKTKTDLQAVMHALKREEGYKTHFLVPVKGDRFVPVSVEQISYFYISDGVVKAVLQSSETFIFQQTLDELAELLNPRQFFRANRQYIIAHKAVVGVSLWFGGRMVLQLTPPTDEKVIISKARVPAFREWF